MCSDRQELLTVLGPRRLTLWKFFHCLSGSIVCSGPLLRLPFPDTLQPSDKLALPKLEEKHTILLKSNSFTGGG